MKTGDNQERILVVGLGNIGQNVYQELKQFDPDTYDIKDPNQPRKHEEYNFVFICVDTPYVSKENPCDISAIEDAIKTWKNKLAPQGIIVIKSSILPHHLDILAKIDETIRLVFSPIIYGKTQHSDSNNFNFDYTILGGNKHVCIEVQQLLQKVHNACHKFRIVDARTASVAKYMENCYLATKVSFCNQFAEISKQAGVDYEDVRELFILDPRVNPSHTFVYNDKPYWDSHCLNKDVAAIAETYDATLLKYITDYNNLCKTNAK